MYILCLYAVLERATTELISIKICYRHINCASKGTREMVLKNNRKSKSFGQNAIPSLKSLPKTELVRYLRGLFIV